VLHKVLYLRRTEMDSKKKKMYNCSPNAYGPTTGFTTVGRCDHLSLLSFGLARALVELASVVFIVLKRATLGHACESGRTGTSPKQKKVKQAER
jgi:hypothetical protein